MHNVLRIWGKGVYKARWFIIVAWLILIILGGSVFAKLPSLLSGGGWDVPNSQSAIAGEQLASQFAGRSESSLTLVLRDPDHAVGTPEYKDKLKQIVDRLKTEEGVADVFSILTASEAVSQGLIGTDKNMSIAFIDMNIKADYVMNNVTLYQERLVEQAKLLGVEAHLVGTTAFQGENSEQSKQGLAKAEMIVFPLILLILLLIFRSVVATITSLVVTISSVLVAMGIVYVVANQVELSVFVTNSALMLGLGIGIDYSLFMINRFKQELENNNNTIDALLRTMETTGHTVLFSAITVIAALSALFVVPLPAIKAIAFGGIAVVFVAGLISLSLLPAILGVLGARINKGKIPFLSSSTTSPKTSGWKRWTKAIMRRPVVYLLAALLILAAVAVPAAGMKLYSPDMQILPADTGVRQGFAMLEQSFGKGATSPISIVLHNEKTDLRTADAITTITTLQTKLERGNDVAHVSSVASFFPNTDAAVVTDLLKTESTLPADVRKMTDRYLSQDGHTALLELQLDQYGASDASKDVVIQLRDTVLPEFALPEGTSFSIGGETMQGIDSSKAINDSLLPALGIMLVLIFIILVVTFRSILLPLKAIILNLFSVAATYGILVLVFAKGYGVEIFNAQANGYIIHFVPILLLALLFGLSTDYEVFLVSRIKEEYNKTGNNDESIAEGMEKTGPLITGAAILMFAVFAGFAFSGALPIQMLGFGMAVAIALDATVVRMFLVPVAMKLLGRMNWWFPGRSQVEAVQVRKPLSNQ
ncbi:MMPL family transporter [Paenibacillus psychroresistens]|nr:MMPL family transporter [Paenibacillus psychroresistens]